MGLFGRDSQPDKPEAKRPLRSETSTTSGLSATTIAQDTRVEGTVSGSADIVIQGEVDGTINSTGRVTVSESGLVKAAIRGRAIRVSGRVEGNLTADELIELEPGGAVHGDLLSPRILIKDGANLQGQVEMSKPPASKESPMAAPAKDGKAVTGDGQSGAGNSKQSSKK
jgi:cytoskeletal protein CcmA (bactofilin family)